MIKIRISPRLANEYADRLPEDLPIEKLKAGAVDLTAEEARAVLADAQFNSDPSCVDVGPYAMPRSTFNAYRKLRDSLRAALST
jgi:hypothetical protein